MSDPTTDGFTDIVDPVTPDTLKQLAGMSAPVVSLLMPTRRESTDGHDALLLRNLADEARDQLREHHADADADQILAPVYALVDDTWFWRTQAEGLAVYADAEQHHVFRVPRTLPQVAHVGAAPRLLPLVRTATGDEAFHILAVSQNSVRLFDATRDSIHQMDLGTAPASLDDMERQGTREPELQHQHVAGGAATFHGHGGADTGGLAVQKFLGEVAAGVRDQIGADSRRPLVLAGVAEHLPVLQATGQLPTLLPESITGNSEHLRAGELLERAWPLVRVPITERREELAERFRAAHGTGNAITDPTELRRAADEGRVGTILAPVEPGQNGRQPDEEDDLAVAAALITGAELAVTELPEGAPVAALLRY